MSDITAHFQRTFQRFLLFHTHDWKRLHFPFQRWEGLLQLSLATDTPPALLLIEAAILTLSLRDPLSGVGTFNKSD